MTKNPNSVVWRNKYTGQTFTVRKGSEEDRNFSWMKKTVEKVTTDEPAVPQLAKQTVEKPDVVKAAAEKEKKEKQEAN